VNFVAEQSVAWRGKATRTIGKRCAPKHRSIFLAEPGIASPSTAELTRAWLREAHPSAPLQTKVYFPGDALRRAAKPGHPLPSIARRSLANQSSIFPSARLAQRGRAKHRIAEPGSAGHCRPKPGLAWRSQPKINFQGYALLCTAKRRSAKRGLPRQTTEPITK
jgi:hypothetical protein